MHLAELNIAKLRYEKGDPRAAEFFDNLDRINGLGERMPGFIWRLKDEEGNATAFEVNEDPMVIANLTVWEGVEALEKFVWQTVHNTGFYRKRSEWFEKMDKPHFVMWWVEEGHLPDLKEALGRLAHLTEHGPSDLAFGWAQTPGAQLWRNARCG
jgi:Domain of unknown function (DUF3291)